MINTDNQPQKHALEFTGSSGEFFKIWIVNVMLSIVTLGIYSAWAKVRTKRYFYGNTLLMGSAFDYLGDPVKILKGRIVAFIFLMLYSFSSTISPIVQGVMALIFMPLIPWVVIKALRFNAYNSAYRNIRFHFNARYSKALGVFIGYPFLVAFSFGLAYPSFVCARKKFILDHTAYGSSRFELSVTSTPFYAVYLKALGLYILFIMGFVGFGYAMKSAGAGGAVNKELIGVATALFIFPLLMLVFTYIYTTITNLVINNLSLENHRFESQLQTGTLFWLYLSNIIAIMLSFGLLIPWAIIRTARYRISTISVCVNGSVDEFIAAETEKVPAIGEEIGDMFDMDIGL